MTTQSWSQALHGRVADAIKSARRGRFTGQELSERTAQLGYPISRSQLANYESGRTRSLDVAELLVLAGALEVPALSLLFPGYLAEQVEVLPGVPMSTLDAVLLCAGDQDRLGPRMRVEAMVGELDRLINAAVAGRGVLTAAACNGKRI